MHRMGIRTCTNRDETEQAKQQQAHCGESFQSAEQEETLLYALIADGLTSTHGDIDGKARSETHDADGDESTQRCEYASGPFYTTSLRQRRVRGIGHYLNSPSRLASTPVGGRYRSAHVSILQAPSRKPYEQLARKCPNPPASLHHRDSR